MKETSTTTHVPVLKTTGMENEKNWNNVRVNTSAHDYSVHDNDKNPDQDLLYRSVCVEIEESMESNSILDIARDVEIIDNFDFDTTDIDEIEDYIESDELS